MLWKGWKSQACGLALSVITIAVLNLLPADSSNAGLFGNRGGPLGFGILAQNCGGGGGGGLQSVGYSGCGGGGGLQYGMYSSCGGAGGGGLQYAPYNACGPVDGGGGLQYAPVSYAPSYYSPPQYYTPNNYYTPSNNCPGGVCPPSQGLSFYRQTNTVARVVPTYNTVVEAVPTGIRLNPGERYVAGSLRSVSTANATAQSKPSSLSRIASDSETRQKSRETAQNAAQSKAAGSNAVYELIQITRMDPTTEEYNCPHCVSDEKLFEAEGVKVTKITFEQDSIRAAALLQKATMPFEGFPYYVLLKNGKPFRDYNRSFGSEDEVQAFATAFFPKPVPETVIAQSKEEDRLARIETMLVQMLETQNKTNEALLSAIKLSSAKQ